MLNIPFAHKKWHREKMENERESVGEREIMEKMSVGWNVFYTKADGFKTNVNTRTVYA